MKKVKVFTVMFDADYADPDLVLTEDMEAVWIKPEPYSTELPPAVEAEICKMAAEIFKSREQTIHAIMNLPPSSK